MEISQQGDLEEPVSPIEQVLGCSDFSCLYIFAFLELESPIDDPPSFVHVLRTLLANPRLNSITVRDEKGVKRWKQVEVSLEDHIIIPELFSPDMSIESCTECFNEYVSRIAMEQPPRFKPLWQLHIIKNPINTIIVQFHHSLGDGYTLMSILFSYFGWNLLKSTWVKDDISPIRSKNEGVEFRPATILNITFSLEQTKEIKSKLGVTVNDVITGVIFYGIRLYMQDIEYESKTNNCTLLTMMSTRDVERYTTAKDMQESKGKGRLGSQIIYLHTSIPKLNDILISNPLQSVWEAHREIKRKRRSFAIVLIEKLLRIQHRFIGPAAMAKHLHRAIRNTSLMVSNIVGPVHQVAFENYPIKSFYFTGSGLPQSVVITIMSYNGKLTVTTRAEADFIDHPKLASYLNSAYEMIRKAALGIPSQEEKGRKKHL